MRERSPNTPPPWHVPVAVEDVAETGRHFDLAADAAVRAAVARLAGVRDLPRLEASFDVTRHGAGGLRVAGRVCATVGQNCVVTLEPLASEIAENVDLVFAPRAVPEPQHGEPEVREEPRELKWGTPEPLIGGIVDLGALATEFLFLGINPYPRRPGVVFDAPHDAEPDPGPFAVLAGLAKDRNGH